MPTNKEWLYSLQPDELAAWFDAQHVEGVEIQGEPDEIADSREKLEADAIQLAQNIWHQGQNYANGVREIRHIAWQERDIIELLDRQAAITERELCKQCDWPSLAAQPDLELQERIAELTAQVDELQTRLEAQINETACQSADYVAEQRLAIELQAQVDELQAERDNLARDLAECDESRIELMGRCERVEKALVEMERERDYWKLHTDCWADKCVDAEVERDAYHERTVELEIELAQANGNLKNTTHNHAAAKAKYERAQADAARARERQLEAERKYAELLEKPPEGAWAERIAVLEAGNEELREKLSRACDNAHDTLRIMDEGLA